MQENMNQDYQGRSTDLKALFYHPPRKERHYNSLPTYFLGPISTRLPFFGAMLTKNIVSSFPWYAHDQESTLKHHEVDLNINRIDIPSHIESPTNKFPFSILGRTLLKYVSMESWAKGLTPHFPRETLPPPLYLQHIHYLGGINEVEKVYFGKSL